VGSYLRTYLDIIWGSADMHISSKTREERWRSRRGGGGKTRDGRWSKMLQQSLPAAWFLGNGENMRRVIMHVPLLHLLGS